jgi:hypothetical protein
MRTIKELLKVMLDNPQYFRSGLCGWKTNLQSANLISADEWFLLEDYIRNHRPNPYLSIKAFKSRKTAYYWPIGDIKPRIKWLKKHIS